MTDALHAPLCAAEELLTPRLRLRRPAPGDFEAFAAYSTSDRTRFIGGPKERRKAFDWWCALAGHWLIRGFGRYVITDRATGRPMGHVGAFRNDDTLPPELAWTLWDGADEGKGYAREAIAEAMRHYREDLGWTDFVAFVHGENAGSIAIAELLGGHLSPVPGYPPLDLRYDFDFKAEAA